MFFYYCFSGEQVGNNEKEMTFVSCKSYQKYFQQDFMKMDIRKIEDPVLLENNPEFEGEFYFGRPRWKNFMTDLREIKHENHIAFFKMLFLQTLLLRTIQTYYPKKYELVKQMKMPHFGWESLTFYHEQIQYILSIPEKHGYVFTNEDIKDMVDTFFDKIVLDLEPFKIDKTELLSKINNDVEIKADKLLQFKNNETDYDKSSAIYRFIRAFKNRYKHLS